MVDCPTLVGAQCVGRLVVHTDTDVRCLVDPPKLFGTRSVLHSVLAGPGHLQGLSQACVIAL